MMRKYHITGSLPAAQEYLPIDPMIVEAENRSQARYVAVKRIIEEGPGKEWVGEYTPLLLKKARLSIRQIDPMPRTWKHTVPLV